MPAFYLMRQGCYGFGAFDAVDHPNLSSPMTGDPGGTLAYNAIMTGLLNRRQAVTEITAARQRIPALPADVSGLDALQAIEKNIGPLAAFLDRPNEAAFRALVADNRTRIQIGVMKARIAEVLQLPDAEASLDTIAATIKDVGKSPMAAPDKAAGVEALQERRRAIARALLADLDKDGGNAPTTLAGLATTRRVLAQMDAIATKAEGSVGRADTPATHARRSAILQDPAVQHGFGEALNDAARRGASPDAVVNRAAQFLLSSEMDRGAGAAVYVDMIRVAPGVAEQQRIDRVLGLREGEGEDAQPGEPTAREMLAAFEDEFAGSNAIQEQIGSRCRPGQLGNDAALGAMCLVQILTGGPAILSTTSFRKISCSDVSGNQAVCAYMFTVDLTTLRTLGVLGQLMMAPGGKCRAVFVRDGRRWRMFDKNCG